MAKNILLILGHPSENSFCKALLDAYQNGAESAGANIKTIYVSRLNFNVTLSDGYKNGTAMQLEDDLVASQELIQWADHVVMAYPNWWGFMPAVTKGFIDRVFLPGFAFKNHSGKTFPEKTIERKKYAPYGDYGYTKMVVLPDLSRLTIPDPQKHCIRLCRV
jgi:NAD(P)H dehydrogenase (quinone)